MEQLSVQVTAQRDIVLPAQELVLAPIGDIQYGADGCSLDALEAYIDRGSSYKHVHYIGMGDFADRYSPSNRTGIALARLSLYDSARRKLDEAGEQDIADLQAILAPTLGVCEICGNPRWLGIHEGHHFHEFEDGTTTDMRMAQWLGCPLLGHTAITFLEFLDSHSHTGEFRIWSRHGEGGASTEGAVIRKLEAAATDFVADLYLMGHYHQRFSIERPRIDWFDSRKRGGPHSMIDRPYRLTATGGYLAGYVAGRRERGRPQGTYIERKGLRPKALGGLFIRVIPRRVNGSGRMVFEQHCDD